ncbi:unnamed protein product [Fraxinus pennsylvanica]|uniref:Uncharacterized protein n=1 Tax=Fraxinus pennsylvanica TaxID=56036 RepID=A0AAD1YSZ7_9LAMI|nr:unnamed protein product [Fraxinus pennsylvanica]
MGASEKWVKALIGLRQPDIDDHLKIEALFFSLKDKMRGKNKKWRLWSSSSGDKGKKSFKGFERIGETSSSIVRGQQVRKQAAITLRCMQALVRVQARVRARRVRMSIEGQAVQQMLDECHSKADRLKRAEEGWCDSRGTLEEVNTKIQMRQAGAAKREKAFAYSLAQKVRLMEQSQTDHLETTPLSKTCVDSTKGSLSRLSEHSSVKVRKNNVTMRISVKPPQVGQTTHSSSSPSSVFRYDESSASSSIFTSTTPVSGNTMFASDRTEESNNVRPSYMNMTEATKAKQRNPRIQRQSMDEFQFLKNSIVVSNGDPKSNAGSDNSQEN